MSVQLHAREAKRPAYTTVATCASCGRVSFAGCWQDIGDGLRRHLAARANVRLTCPRCSDDHP